MALARLVTATAAAFGMALGVAAMAPAPPASGAPGGSGAPGEGEPPLGLPHVWTPDDNPGTREAVELGRRLFSDPILSRDRTISCATCHPPENAYADGKPLAVGIDGQVQPRNAPSLLNVAFAGRPFHDGRVATLEEQAAMPLLNTTEMDLSGEEAVRRLSADPDYPRLFDAAYGGGGVTFDRMRKALAAFERTLVAGDSDFDRWWAAGESGHSEREFEMDESRVRGFRLFMGRARCSTCHPVRQSFALFTDVDFHNTGAGEGLGREDVGRMAATGRAEDRGKFKTPTLRNVALTAPYMHDGSLATLMEVVEFYDRGGEPNPHLDEDMRPLLLSERDKRDLVAFLRSLTSPVLPQTGDGAALLARGEYRGARERFLRDLERNPADREALFGLAEASLGTGDPAHLEDAVERLVSADADGISAEARGRTEIWRGRLFGARAALAEAAGDGARAEAHRLDEALAFSRARDAAPFLDDAYFEGAAAEEATGRPELAERILSALLARHEGNDPDARAARAALRYRLALAAARAAGDRPDDAARALFRGAVEDARAKASLADRDFDTALVLARSLHWLGEVEEARAAYLAAIPLADACRPALTGLANLLRGEAWTAALKEAARENPDSRQVLYFLAFDRLSRGDREGAERTYRRLAGLVPGDSMTRVFLGRIARDAGRLDEAWGHWETALRLDPRNGEAVNDWDGTLRALPLGGWEDVSRLDASLRRLLSVAADPYMNVVVRNNIAFRIREAVSTYTSRGRGRMQYLVPGAPPEALRWIRRCVTLYEEAVADIPPDEALAELPFAVRWVHAGVLNDAGLMLHYFEPVQDLERAEERYLRAFRITDGAYMDAYFYNLQFLYGFEMKGKERRWLRLAATARDVILKEDPESETGFAPDERKRAAAERDYERLRDLLGEKEADEIEREELP